jgi:hypothetical protein
VSEEQEVHADHDGYQRKHVKRGACLSSHRFVLLCATEWSKSGSQRPQPARMDLKPVSSTRTGAVTILQFRVRE